MTNALIGDVSDTAYWIAHLRSVETQRSDSLFRDPLAGLLAGDRGKAIADSMPYPSASGWAIVMRTCIIDDYVRAAIAEGCDTVLNLGAGLDTRPYRLELPASLKWIEVDFPATIELKEERLAGETPRCQLRRVKLDLGDAAERRALLDEIDAQSGKVLVLTEGVVPYLSNEDVAALARDLEARPHFYAWVLEYVAPQFLKIARLMMRRRRRQLVNAPMKFKPGDWHAFFSEHGWAAREIRYLAEEGVRLERSSPTPRWAWIVTRLMSREKRRALARNYGYAWLARSTRA